MRIGVVGAGPAGLLALYELQRSGIPGLEITCFERGGQVGGEWIFSETVGNDDYGLPVHGSMYKGMRANLPTDLMVLHPDYPWPKGTLVFPYREDILKHISNFADSFNLTKHIKFFHYVEKVSRVSNDSTKVRVNVRELKSNSNVSTIFDYVLLCGGKHGKAHIPHETSKFTGMALHYHDLKDPKRLSGKRVAIIGGGFGAMDMVLHLRKVASSLILSYHKKPPFFGEQPWVVFKPQVINIENNNITFEDGTSCEVDVLLYATGFKAVHPLTEDLELNWNMGRYFFPLYKHIVHPNFPSIMFVGKSVSATILMSRLQASFACGVIKGLIKLPSSEKMNQAINEFHSRWSAMLADPPKPPPGFLPKLELEFENAAGIVEMCGCLPIPYFRKRLYYSLIKLVMTDLVNYQNYYLKLTKKEENGEFDIEWIPPEVRKIV